MDHTTSVGDLVQAPEDITEPDFMGQALFVHAKKNAVGHVMDFDGDAVIVTWERTGTTVAVWPHQIKRLCDHAGRLSLVPSTGS